MCDVQSLIQVTLNQKLLLAALLPDTQTTLFINQRSRAIRPKPLKTSNESDSDERFADSEKFTGNLKQQLTGFQTNDRLSRMLLLGILPKVQSKSRKEKRLFNQSDSHISGLTQMNGDSRGDSRIVTPFDSQGNEIKIQRPVLMSYASNGAPHYSKRRKQFSIAQSP